MITPYSTHLDLLRLTISIHFAIIRFKIILSKFDENAIYIKNMINYQNSYRFNYIYFVIYSTTKMKLPKVSGKITIFTKKCSPV